MKKRLENRWEVGVWRESGMWRQTCVLINSEIYRWKTERERKGNYGWFGLHRYRCSSYYAAVFFLLLFSLWVRILRKSLWWLSMQFLLSGIEMPRKFLSSCAISTDYLPVFFFRFIVSRSVGLFVSAIWQIDMRILLLFDIFCVSVCWCW